LDFGGQMNNGLQYISNNKIDFKKWDRCLACANNSRVYAFSWFLDRTAEKWDALVWGDYEFVMPLPVRKKWGIRYVYQPVFCQQLGIFPEPPISVQEQFVGFLSEKFRYIQIQVTPQINQDVFSKFEVTEKANLVLPLMADYKGIALQFSQNVRRNIVKAGKEGISVVRGLNPAEFIDGKKTSDLAKSNPKTFENLSRIMSFSISESTGIIYAAYTQQNELCSAAFFLQSGTRVVYLSAFSTSEGKRSNAMHLIVDEFIRDYAGSGNLLDFEGSSIEGVARFYKGFGAFTETYYLLKYNQLPFPLNMIKK
jgi:hypothetical protein